MDDQAKLEAWLKEQGYTREEQWTEYDVLITKYSKLGIGVRIEKNLK